MPYLNWRDAQLEQEVQTSAQTGSAREFRLTLKLSGAQIEELVPYLQEIYFEEGHELRIDLPREWIMFWKLRAGESRLLMAHPQPEEWVSTLALNASHGQGVVDALKSLIQGQTVSLESLGAVGYVSNVEVLLTRAS